MNAVQTITFIPNNTLGLLTNPYIWSNTGLSHQANILTYFVPQQVSQPVIDTTALTIHLYVPYATNVTALAASFTLSAFATARVGTTLQQSGVTSNDFTNPLVYTVIAEDPAYTKNWTVTVTVLPAFNTGTDILSYSFSQQTGPAVIDTGNHSVSVEVMYGTALNNLVAGFTLSPGAIAKIGNITQVSGVTANDFSASVIYRVIAGDTAIKQNWTITVTVALPPCHGTDIITYSFPEQSAPAVIDTLNHLVNIHVTGGTDLTSLVATFTLSQGATARISSTIQVSSVTANNFSYPVIYDIEAEDDSTHQNWIVMVDTTNSIEENLLGESFSAYPNPTRGILNISCRQEADIQIWDITGKLVFTNAVNYPVNKFDISFLDNGCYILKLAAGRDSVFAKIIIRK
jgi:hypothetical protein